MLPTIVLGQAEQHSSLCVKMVSSLYPTEQLVCTRHQPVKSFENLKTYGQKAYPIEVPTELDKTEFEKYWHHPL